MKTVRSVVQSSNIISKISIGACYVKNYALVVHKLMNGREIPHCFVSQLFMIAVVMTIYTMSQVLLILITTVYELQSREGCIVYLGYQSTRE